MSPSHDLQKPIVQQEETDNNVFGDVDPGLDGDDDSSVEEMEDSLPPAEDKAPIEEEDVQETPTSAETKYLTFLPHSGFHNQRIAAQNAFYLAHLLNRTLLLPPAMIGKVFGWRPYDTLLKWHLLHSKAGHDECAKFADLPADEQKAVGVSTVCDTMNGYTYVRWDLLYNLSELGAKIPFIPRDYFTDEYLQTEFDISTQQTWYFKDTFQYDAMIFDTNVDPDPASHDLEKYHSLLRVPDLAARPEKLIHLGSLFGSSRMVASTKERRTLRGWINSQFIFSNRQLIDTVDHVVETLGGPRSYVSLHARVGDGAFERNRDKVLTQLWADFSKKFPPLPGPPAAQVTPAQCLDPATRPLAVQNGSLPFIFMATDDRNPRAAKYFSKFYEAYPCIFTLADVLDYPSSPLAELKNPVDGLKMGKFMIPFLDGMVASRASDFTTSIWSTFSMYIRFIHKDFTKKWEAQKKASGSKRRDMRMEAGMEGAD
ncbi:hypothetical protein BC938DRAFT_470941 [Jimgerdemannia flammicorona]|uniref:GDP-fucose protein O-fucosyltransferase-domain-containing protein n=1 Tax=Jimgerdemannia flammicorona TaxID=994334 RepID=A0A433Q970_9FUNG|nr:hypothetical protein BC938DRAFT_470941 [Jimgerdemannia flammicorona]